MQHQVQSHDINRGWAHSIWGHYQLSKMRIECESNMQLSKWISTINSHIKFGTRKMIPLQHKSIFKLIFLCEMCCGALHSTAHAQCVCILYSFSLQNIRWHTCIRTYHIRAHCTSVVPLAEFIAFRLAHSIKHQHHQCHHHEYTELIYWVLIDLVTVWVFLIHTQRRHQRKSW